MLKSFRSIGLILVIVAALTVSLGALEGCTRKVAQDPTKPASPALDQISVQLARVKEGVRAATDAKRALLAQGKISKETSHTLSLKLLKVSQVANEANDKADEYDTLDPVARSTLEAKFTAIRTAYDDLTRTGALAGSPGVDRALAVIAVALAELDKLIH